MSARRQKEAHRKALAQREGLRLFATYYQRLENDAEYLEWVGGKVLDSIEHPEQKDAIMEEILHESIRRVDLLMAAERAGGDA